MSTTNGVINSSDVDIIPDESFINHNINQFTIKERITGHTLLCCSYTKHWSKSPNDPPTGYVPNDPSLTSTSTNHTAMSNEHPYVMPSSVVYQQMISLFNQHQEVFTYTQTLTISQFIKLLL